MKLLQLVVILTLLVCLMEAANIDLKAEEIGIPKSNEDAMGMDKAKESYNRAYEEENEEAVTSVKTQALKEEMKRDVKSKNMHTVTTCSLCNTTVTNNCYTTITGFQRPFYIQIVGNEVFLTEYGTQYVHVLDVHTGSTLRKFAIPFGYPTGLFIKGNKVLVTNVKRETYSFSLSGDLFGVHYSYQPVGVAVDYNGLM